MYCKIIHIRDQIFKNLPFMHKDKYLEIHNSFIQGVISQEELLQHNSTSLYDQQRHYSS